MSTSKKRKNRSLQSSSSVNANAKQVNNVPRSSFVTTKVSTSSSSRSSGRQVKVATQGFNFGGLTTGQREQYDSEKAEKELIRERRKREQRLEELERGVGPSSSWNDTSSFNVPAASTSAAAIAGLLAGRQAEQEGGYDDLSTSQSLTSIGQTGNTNPSHASNNKRKQSAELKRFLTQRRSLKLLLEDAAALPAFKDASNNFMKSLEMSNTRSNPRASRPICSICGYWGEIRCLRCNERVCGLKCSTTHNETRCERPL